MAAKSADQARAEAALKSSQQAAAAKAAAAKAAADKAAAVQAAAKKAAADKAAATKKVAAKKEADYIKSLSNPITSQYDPRIAQGGRVTAGGTISLPNAEMAATQMTSSGVAPVAKIESGSKFPKAGTILRYKPGSKPGTRIPVYADGYGGEFDGEETSNPIEPGSSGFIEGGTVTLARNTFANTLALLVGEFEASQPWVNELYDLMQGYLNTGSTVEEAQNLALREAKNKGTAGKFVQRFSAIFKLQDRLNAGEAVQVPSIADYVKSEQKLGDVFRAVGLGELATQEMAAKILGDANKSVSEATAIISDVFNAIDNAPEALKRDLATYFPGADRTSVAKALLTGKEGALELSKKVKSVEQLSAAKTQGIQISLAEGANLAAGGADYATSLGKFETVKQLERGQSLGRMSSIDFTQQEAISSAFNSNAAANEKIRKIKEEEANRFSGSAGRLASRNRAQGAI